MQSKQNTALTQTTFNSEFRNVSLDVKKLDLDAKPIESYFFKAMYEISFDLFLTMQFWLYY